MARRNDETDGSCRASWDLVPVPVTGRQGTAAPVTREIGRPRGRPGPADARVLLTRGQVRVTTPHPPSRDTVTLRSYGSRASPMRSAEPAGQPAQRGRRADGDDGQGRGGQHADAVPHHAAA
ncbi:hypothetical protein GCM10010250_32520 [Streptomyces althioticus]|nr:hypothetical protein GCM10010250_32520 [Streptomyces althioticus]